MGERLRESAAFRPRHPRGLGPAAAVAIPLLLAGLACATGASESAAPPVLDARFPEGRRTLPLAALLGSEGLAPDEALRVHPVGRDDATSHHLVWVRDAEQPHRHDHHDLLVVVLRGHGAMRLGGEERRVGPGSILYVPRGTVHAFRNASGEPAVAYAVYTPPFDGKDRISAE